MKALRFPGRSRKHRSLMIEDDDEEDKQNKEDILATGGVFVSMRRTSSPFASMDDSSSCSLSSIGTAGTADETCAFSPASSWKSSGSTQHHQNSPLIVSDPEHPKAIQDEMAELTRQVERSKKLPKSSWYYASNHIMINTERSKSLTAPLTRLRELDQIAREQAEKMAAKNTLFHSTPEDLQAKFQRPCRRLGENVSKGKDIQTIHKSMMETLAHRNNILDRRYTHMGMATARGPDGDLFLCQVFRG